VLKPYLQLLLENSVLSYEQAEGLMLAALGGADMHQFAAILAIMRYRGEAPSEVAGMVSALQKKAVSVHLPVPVMDIVGTGGDQANTVNISTGAAILAAACGIPIAKHGNRAATSRSGGADVLEALGIDIEATPEQLPRYIENAGIGFMFAPVYHPSFKQLAPLRRALKIPTVLNLLGTLTNPAKAEYALIGVASLSALKLFSQVLPQLGHKKRILLFHGQGVDELTPLGKIQAYDIRGGHCMPLEIDPAAYGFAACTLNQLQGGDAATNAALLTQLFAGRFPTALGALADTLILNAGAAVWIFGAAATLEEGIQIARQALLEGRAMQKLEQWRALSKQLKKEREQCKAQVI
jgi:anthranilate phosphoribosyltransferase